MAVTKKTVEEIAKENAIDISKENAKKVADAYIQPTLNEINVAEQKAIANTQAARKALENDYFNQYRANTYEAQSRGLTGGLAQMDNQLLRMQMGQANADLSKQLLLSQNEAASQRGTALSNAEVYKTEYLNDMLQRVSDLREKDYAQRLAEWQYAQEMAMAEREFAEAQRQWQLEYNLSRERYNMEKEAFELEKAQAEKQNKLEDIQYEAYVDEYLDNQLPDVASTYMAYMNSGNTDKAMDYLMRQATNLSNKYGIDRSQIINQVGSIQKYNLAKNTAADETLLEGLSDARWKSNLAKGTNYVTSAASIIAAPFTFGLSLLPQIGISSWLSSKAKEYGSAYDTYKQTIENAERTRDTLASTLPSWYQQ